MVSLEGGNDSLVQASVVPTKEEIAKKKKEESEAKIKALEEKAEKDAESIIRKKVEERKNLELEIIEAQRSRDERHAQLEALKKSIEEKKQKEKKEKKEKEDEVQREKAEYKRLADEVENRRKQREEQHHSNQSPVKNEADIAAKLDPLAVSKITEDRKKDKKSDATTAKQSVELDKPKPLAGANQQAPLPASTDPLKVNQPSQVLLTATNPSGETKPKESHIPSVHDTKVNTEVLPKTPTVDKSKQPPTDTTQANPTESNPKKQAELKPKEDNEARTTVDVNAKAKADSVPIKKAESINNQGPKD